MGNHFSYHTKDDACAERAKCKYCINVNHNACNICDFCIHTNDDSNFDDP